MASKPLPPGEDHSPKCPQNPDSAFVLPAHTVVSCGGTDVPQPLHTLSRLVTGGIRSSQEGRVSWMGEGSPWGLAHGFTLLNEFLIQAK